MTLVQVLQGKKIKNIAKSFADILIEPFACLRDHVFRPVLWKCQFLLLWYCKKNNEVILYHSTSPVDTYLVFSVEKFLLSFLSNFCSSPPALKVAHMVEQKESSSCGAYVCYTADAIASNVLEVKVIFMEMIIGCGYFLHLSSIPKDVICSSKLFCKMSIMQRFVLQTLETIAGSILSCRLFSAFCLDQAVVK